MANIFDFRDYRDAIIAAVESKKKTDGKFNFKSLAAQAKIQKTYLSKVLNKNGHLSADQVFAVAEVFGWTGEEVDYVTTLMEISRSQSESRRKNLQEKAQRIVESVRGPRREISSSLRMTAEEVFEFYHTPWLLQVCTALDIPKFAKSPQELAAWFGITEQDIESLLATLLKLKMVEKTEKGFKLLHTTIQMTDYPLHNKVARYSVKLQTLQRLVGDHHKEDKSMYLLFAADREAKKVIQAKLQSFQKELLEHVRDSEAQVVYQLSLDFFAWTD